VSEQLNDFGTLNTADFTLWRDSPGQTGPDLAADGNGDNVVDELDYQIWQTGLGQAAINVELSSAVPEPASLVLSIGLLAAVITACRHSHETHN